MNRETSIVKREEVYDNGIFIKRPPVPFGRADFGDFQDTLDFFGAKLKNMNEAFVASHSCTDKTTLGKNA